MIPWVGVERVSGVFHWVRSIRRRNGSFVFGNDKCYIC